MSDKPVKSPLNYTGGKFKLLPQLLPYFPSNVDTFVDLFCGGGNVGVNTKANKFILNDTETHIINLLSYFKTTETSALLQSLKDLIGEYGLSDTSTNGYAYYGANSSDGVALYNKEKYLKLRSDFNKDTSNELLFFLVVIFAFSNQIRFNSKGHFNMPVNKRDFNATMQQNTKAFVDKLHQLPITFSNLDFRKVDLSLLSSDDFVYCDPPYSLTCASYNENNGWNETNERGLYTLLDELSARGIRFALSNVLENKGKQNLILQEWASQYHTYDINAHYGNCNYHAKDKSTTSTKEILVTNYKKV